MNAQAGPGRYVRHTILAQIGPEGQARIREARVLVLGLGGLGGHLASAMVRAGVGRVRLVDRDMAEEHNLHRQTLYDEKDVAEGLPKAVAAARKLSAVNRDVEVEGLVRDVNRGNIEELLDGCAVALDGADNFELRLLLNDAAGVGEGKDGGLGMNLHGSTV